MEGTSNGKEDLFNAAASNDVAFLSSRIEIPTPADKEGCRSVPASSPSTCCHPGVSARDEANREDTREQELEAGKRWTAEGIRSLEDEDGRSLLHVAAAAGHLEAVDFLLRAGVDLLKADEGEWTPLHSAASGGHLPVVRALISAAQQQQKSEWGSSGSSGDKRDVLRELLEAKTPSGTTALTIAAAKGSGTPVVEALLDAGADTEATDNYGRTALSRAVAASNETVVDLLLTRGANVTVEEKFTGENLLHLAVNAENADLCLLLMRKDPSLKFKKNREGVTAFEAGRTPFLKHLAYLYEEENGTAGPGAFSSSLDKDH
ncbi:ankyrin repeat-containing protein [Cystoisospora suis]|uniref:Ankyrin repeat-containing protein n=1 Tax=Cystoisospora suis TaxID=483139 RepID=A0A2C6KSI8_9APIC|nr:ankyrin repeat-containing protein [Cystoisospora suis]